jgi:hypothetical protein
VVASASGERTGRLGTTWGSTSAERQLPFPCDRHLPDADEALYRAVDVAAPAPLVFRWLCQLKAAPYSYDWIDNLGRRSPRQLTPGLEELRRGERVMTIFELVEFAPNEHVTLLLRRSRLFGAVACSYVVRAVDPRHSRLLVKLLVRYPRTSVLAALTRAILPAGDLVMMRKQLLTLKGLAERDAAAALRSAPPTV